MRKIAVSLCVLVSTLAVAGAREGTTDTATVRRGDLAVTASSSGKVVPGQFHPVDITPRAWRGRYLLREALEPGARVTAGDVVLRFDDEELREAVEDARFDLEVARGNLEELTLRHEMQEEKAREGLEHKILDLKRAEWALEDWLTHDKPQSDARSALELKGSALGVENAREELRQLERMYEEDELVDETEEIVLRRAKWDAEQRQRSHELRLERRGFSVEVEEPRHLENLENQVRWKKAELARNRLEGRMAERARQIEMERARKALERQERNLGRLEADLANLVVRAPADGVLLHGALEGGLDRRYTLDTPVNVSPVVATIAGTEGLVFEARFPSREALRLAAGARAVVEIDAEGAGGAEGAVRTVSPLPQGGKFTVQVVPAAELPAALLGVEVEVRVEVARAEGVLLVPSSAVREEEGVSWCLVRRPDGAEERVEVETGLTDGEETVVVSGLSEGDEVVLPGDEG